MREKVLKRFDVEVVEVNVTASKIEIVVAHLFSVGRVTWFLRKATASSLDHPLVLPYLTASMAPFGLPRRGHRLFGNVDSFW